LEKLANEGKQLEGLSDVQISKENVLKNRGSELAGDANRATAGEGNAERSQGELGRGELQYRESGSDVGKSASGVEEKYRSDRQVAGLSDTKSNTIERIRENTDRIAIVKERLSDLRTRQSAIDSEMGATQERTSQIKARVNDLQVVEKVLSERIGNYAINQPLTLTMFPSQKVVSPIDLVRAAFPKEIETAQAGRGYNVGELMPNGRIAGEGPGAASVTELPVTLSESTTQKEFQWNPVNGPGPIGERAAKTFRSATYTEKILEQDLTLYREWGGNANEFGRYWTIEPPNGKLQSQIGSAVLPEWGNNLDRITTIRVPKGTTIYEGIAASQKSPCQI